MSFADLPHNVLDDIAMFSCRLLKLTLALLTPYLRHTVYKDLYKNIMVLDSLVDVADCSSTIVCTDTLALFAACLNPHTFCYIQRIVINTHGANSTQLLLRLYEKLSILWNACDHAIEFVNYDVLSLRTANSLNNYLTQNSLLFMDVEEENCIITRKDHKSLNLKNWFVTDTSEILSAPYNDELRQLNLYVESNAYGTFTDSSLTVHFDSTEAPLLNLAGLTDVFLHSPLAYLKFTEMMDTLQCPRLQLKRLSVTCSHRARNNAPLDFNHMNRYFDLNLLDELEVQLCCVFHHECSNYCMIKFFEDWKRHNTQTSTTPDIRKFALVNYKNLGETEQFKYITENYVFGGLFPNVSQLYFNYDLGSTALCIDWSKICNGLKYLPYLQSLHVSKFVNDWLRGLPDLIEEVQLRNWEVMLNRCTCDNCKQYRSSFSELARVDKSNHYNHKVRLRDIDTKNALTSSIDFNLVENVKYLHYVTSQLRKEELIMEQNLHSTGTMLNAHDMPIVHNKELDPFREMVKHSCLTEVFNVLQGYAPLLHTVNFGGIKIDSNLLEQQA